jgi:hypothetical protein
VYIESSISCTTCLCEIVHVLQFVIWHLEGSLGVAYGRLGH